MKTEPSERFKKFFNATTADRCWEWNGARKVGGYGKFRLGAKMVLAHIFAWELNSNRQKPGGMEIMHTCDNPPCVNPAHLKLGTHSDNMKDCAAKKRHPNSYRSDWCRGEKNGSSRLTAEQVKFIRNSGKTSTELASLFGIARSHARNIMTGRAWRSVS